MTMIHSNSYALLSPYPAQASPRSAGARNLGDGLILRAIERLLRPHQSLAHFSPRVAPTPQAQQLLAQTGNVVLTGANQLDDRYSIWPGLTAAALNRGDWRFLIFGLGIDEDPSRHRRMSQPTREILEAVHQRTEFSAWRCPATLRYLRRELPHLADRFLMTGCPVLMDAPLLESQRFNSRERSVAVTATERGDFWARETSVIDRVARRFPRARRYFVVHQDLCVSGLFGRLRGGRDGAHDPRMAMELRRYALSHGYQVLIPGNADIAMSIYDSIDVHVGSRLRAHLLFLSRNRRSWLVPVDAQAAGMAEAFHFPLVTPSAPEPDWNFDFEPLREQARAASGDMGRLLASWARR